MDPTLLAEEALAAASITRLVTTDVVTRPARHGLIRFLRKNQTPVEHKIEELLGCPWCVSLYVSLGVIALRVIPGGALLRRALALRWTVGVLASRVAQDSADWPTELNWPPHRGPGEFPCEQGTLEELHDEQMFWQMTAPATINQMIRRDRIDATIAEFEARAGAPKVRK